MGHLFLLFKRR